MATIETEIRQTAGCIHIDPKTGEAPVLCPYCHSASLTYLIWFMILSIIISFREELSSELVLMSLQEEEQSKLTDNELEFSEEEIDELLDFKSATVLDINEVPHWNMMFFNTRRISFPRRQPEITKLGLAQSG